MKKTLTLMLLVVAMAISAFAADQNSMQKDALSRLYGSVSRITVADIKTVMISQFEYSKEITLKTAEEAIASVLAVMAESGMELLSPPGIEGISSSFAGR